MLLKKPFILNPHFMKENSINEDENHFIIRIKKTIDDKFVWILLMKINAKKQFQIVSYSVKDFKSEIDCMKDAKVFIAKNSEKINSLNKN